MLPIKDAPRSTPGQADPSAVRAPESARPGSSRPESPRPGGHGGPQRPREAGNRDARAQGSPNIQDVFLNYARREKLTVVIQLLDGQSVEGRIKNFDRFALVVDHGGVDHLVFKHAIATIRSPRSIGSYYASHEAS